MADAHKNFAVSTVATAPSPATSGTSLVVASGDGALFPAVPFNATVWPASSQPTATNAEIVRVTARSTDTLTITRAQESSSARTIVVGDQIAATVTAKTLTDIENGLGGPAWTTVIKTADESVTSSTTLQNDDDLFFTPPSAGIYEVEVVLAYASPVGEGTPDMILAFGEDTALRGWLSYVGWSTADSSTSGLYSAANNATITVGTGGGKRGFRMTGTYINDGAGIAVRLLWAQANSNANAVTMYAGSLIRYRKIA